MSCYYIQCITYIIHNELLPTGYTPMGMNGGSPNLLRTPGQVGGPAGMPVQPMGNGMVGKFHNKSVPNLSSSLNDDTSSGPGGPGGGPVGPRPAQQNSNPPAGISRVPSSNYLGPADSMMNSVEPRRHSTSGVPGYGNLHSYYHGYPQQRPQVCCGTFKTV